MTSVRRADTCGWRRLPDRLLLLPAAGDVVTLLGTGPLVWDLLAGPRRAVDVAQTLAEQFAAPAEEVSADVQTLVDALLGLGALEPIP